MVEDYLDRVDSVVDGDKFWRVGGYRINVSAELEAAESRFNEALVADPWIRARAKENMRAARVPVTEASVASEARRIAVQYLAETETRRAWRRGMETWIGILPVIGPSYAIAEGIRHGNPWEVVMGSVFLGLDALDLFGGETLEPDAASSIRPGLPVHEHVTVNSIKHALHE